MAVHNKTTGLGGETNFELKYVPQLGRITEPGGPKDLGLRIGPTRPERRGLTTLVLAAVLVGSVAWYGFGSASAPLAAVRVGF